MESMKMTHRISKTLSITLPPEYARRVDEQRQREQRSASEIIREALRAYYGIGYARADGAFSAAGPIRRSKARASA